MLPESGQVGPLIVACTLPCLMVAVVGFGFGQGRAIETLPSKPDDDRSRANGG